MIGAMIKLLRTRWRILTLTVLIIVSIGLSGLVWIMPFRGDRLNEVRSTHSTPTTDQQAMLYVPTTVIKTDNDREQQLLFGQPQNVALTAQESLQKWELSQAHQIAKGSVDVYRNYLRQSNSLLLSYPSAVSLQTFNDTFNQKLSANGLKKVNHILIPLKTTGKLYLMSDQNWTVYRYNIRAEKLSKLRAALTGGERRPVEYRQINNQVVLTYPHAISLPTYAAKVNYQSAITFTQALLNNSQSGNLASRQDGQQVIYHNGTNKRLVYNRTNGELKFENYLEKSKQFTYQEADGHFYRRLQQTGLVLEGLRFDSYRSNQRQMIYRTYVEGFPIYNEHNYGAIVMQQNQQGLEEMTFSDASLGTPLPKTAGSVTLPSTAVVFNALRANGELKAVQGIRIGYQWKTNRNATSVTLVPTYYVKIGNQWENYQVLIHKGGRQ